jgi:hypothetical protein
MGLPPLSIDKSGGRCIHHDDDDHFVITTALRGAGHGAQTSSLLRQATGQATGPKGNAQLVGRKLIERIALRTALLEMKLAASWFRWASDFRACSGTFLL